jgi:hypothetical protein
MKVKRKVVPVLPLLKNYATKTYGVVEFIARSTNLDHGTRRLVSYISQPLYLLGKRHRYRYDG